MVATRLVLLATCATCAHAFGPAPRKTFKATLKTDIASAPIVVEVHEEWAPRGASRFKALLDAGFYNGAAIFRVVPGFVVQFGINGTPAENARWNASYITVRA